VYGGNDIIEQIANRTGVSKETVGAKLFGGEGSPKELDLAESMGAACQKLATDVTDTLRYYNAQEKQGGADKIHICGGFSLADGFVEALNGQLPAEAVLWNPFDKMRCTGGQGCEELVRKKGPALAVAAGFAMRSI
jgi:type IV pilus assembly protein PilM